VPVLLPDIQWPFAVLHPIQARRPGGGAGRASQAQLLVGPPPLLPGSISVFRPLMVRGHRREPARGSTWQPRLIGPLAAVAAPPPGFGLLAPTNPVKRGRKKVHWQAATGGAPFTGAVRPIVQQSTGPLSRARGNGRVLFPRYPTPGVPVPHTPLRGMLVSRREGELRRGLGYLLRWSPAPLGGVTVLATGYHIYSNAGSGPINYNTPIATVYGLTWTSGPLAFPDTWMFGVRAFDGDGEEQNLDCAITLILDGSGHDITNRPKPPFGLRAFALAGGAIRAEWSYNVINPSPVPTGFHVYLGTVQTGVLFPVSPLSSGLRGKWRPGSVRWRGAVGSGMNYGSPAVTVSFQSAIAGTFVANIPGLMNGVVYSVGVRAYNAVAEEPNTSTVSVTADSVGPSPVVSLAVIAIA
jgi:hypothetical protein